MHELPNLKEMRAWSRAERARGRRVGFVPTMGFLHEGHLRLVDRAKERADRVVMSIFVNPLQFGPAEDLAQYPHDLERDRQLAGERGVDCLFVPDTAAMYPAEPLVRVSPGPMADPLEGAARPGSTPAPGSWSRRRSARRGSSTTWCSGKAWPPTRPCGRDGASSMGGGHAGAPRACRACRRAPRHLGCGDARARGRARALAQGGLAARRAARRARGKRAPPRPARGRTRRADRRGRPGSARRGALPLARLRSRGRRRQDALSGGLSRAVQIVRSGAAALARSPRARRARRDSETGRGPPRRAGHRQPLAAPPGDRGLLERARRILIAGATALAACRGDRGSGAALPVPGAGSAGPRVTVEVLNASGTPGLARIGTRMLRHAGIDVLTYGNAPATVGTLDSTRIVVRRGTEEVGRRVRRALGLGRVVVQPDSARLLDASVLLGADFTPRLEFHP